MKHLPPRKATAFVVLLILLLARGPATAGAAAKQPFYPGEKLVFKFYWSIIPTGSGILKVLPIETLGGVRAYHYRVTTRTNAFADLFYKVRSLRPHFGLFLDPAPSPESG